MELVDSRWHSAARSLATYPGVTCAIFSADISKGLVSPEIRALIICNLSSKLGTGMKISWVNLPGLLSELSIREMSLVVAPITRPDCECVSSREASWLTILTWLALATLFVGANRSISSNTRRVGPSLKCILALLKRLFKSFSVVPRSDLTKSQQLAMHNRKPWPLKTFWMSWDFPQPGGPVSRKLDMEFFLLPTEPMIFSNWLIWTPIPPSLSNSGRDLAPSEIRLWKETILCTDTEVWSWIRNASSIPQDLLHLFR